MIDFGRVLKSPTQDERWVSKVIIGGLFPLIPLLAFISMITTATLAAGAGTHWLAAALLGAAVTVSSAVFVLSPLLNFFPFGYIIARARTVYEGGGEKLPEWKNWKKLFRDGAMYFLVYFVYKLIPVLTAVWSVVFPLGGAGGAFIRYATGLLAFLLWLGAAFLIPMALCNFVAKGRIGAAFDFNGIFDRIKTAGKDYVSAYAVSLGIFLAIYLVSLFTGVIIIGWILFPFLMFYASIALAGMFMEIYPRDAEVEDAGEEVLEPEVME